MSKKPNRKRKLIIYSLLLIIIFIYLLAFYPLGIGSNFGVRPISHHCAGLTIKSKKIINPFPKKDITFFSTPVREFRYFVPALMLVDRPLCLGFDIWYGE